MKRTYYELARDHWTTTYANYRFEGQPSVPEMVAEFDHYAERVIDIQNKLGGQVLERNMLLNSWAQLQIWSPYRHHNEIAHGMTPRVAFEYLFGEE